ncbi:MAG: glycoside hydrolase family 127 protein, partial [Candidatus Latescibacteria bacterium]|nr:glycoside hydrolase family 127 protein [Candidatus Latescibacterota bacterium]
RETDNEKYLDCAKRIIDGRGSNPKPGGLFYREAGVLGTDLFQDRVPLRKEKEVVGHNVFFTYLYTGAADVYLETGDETLRDVLVHLWHDLTAHKICVNGGVSPMGHGLSLRHDPICEAVGPAYHLPSAASYNETCGQIGNFLWNYRMLCIEANAAYADMMELEIYNGIQSGIGLDGASWWYRNPLRRYDTSYTESGLNDMAERGLPGKTRICCPSNLVRTVAELQSYFYSTSTEGIWIHHFGGNTFTGQLPSGETVQLEQITDYPWDGKISIIIHQTSNQPFAINVRIPQWAEDAQLSINGEPISEPAPSTYATIRRTWHEGDTINLNLPMPIRLIQAHPKAEQLRNQVAIMRGPLLYCLESPDFPEEIDL